MMNQLEVMALMETAGCNGCEIAWQLSARIGPPRLGFRHSRPGTTRVDYHGMVSEELAEKLRQDHAAWGKGADCKRLADGVASPTRRERFRAASAVATARCPLH